MPLTGPFGLINGIAMVACYKEKRLIYFQALHRVAARGA